MPRHGINRERAADTLNARARELQLAQGEDEDRSEVIPELVDIGLALASEKVLNGLRNGGLGLEDGTVSHESIRSALSAKLGAELEDLSPDAVLAALNASLSYRIGSAIGLDDFDLGELREQGVQGYARDAALRLIASGRASQLVPAAALRQLKEMAALQEAGLGAGQLATIRNRIKARRWRATHRQTWV